ncbi:MAG: hypothetical protein ABJM29_19305 [Rhizobiaceae bacterium]
MFHFLFKIVGLFVLALAVVLAVLDITRSITASDIILTPLASTWATISPQSLVAGRDLVQTWTHPYLWDPVMTFVLQLPSWLVFWLLAMIFLKLGQRRRNPYGRFASR